jgi:transcriptional regulator
VQQDLTALVVMMREAGSTQAEIAEELNTNQTNVSRILAKARSKAAV